VNEGSCANSHQPPNLSRTTQWYYVTMISNCSRKYPSRVIRCDEDWASVPIPNHARREDTTLISRNQKICLAARVRSLLHVQLILASRQFLSFFPWPLLSTSNIRADYRRHSNSFFLIQIILRPTVPCTHSIRHCSAYICGCELDFMV